ncbi:hypothetical protein [Haloferula sp. BvORR071]|uniref:hypothetical protein n=1 Tax=Haloferula sp. BvORR071 TaxID=1396141 RepID=UPI0005526618|nr:hypothetical protein [Haloferula sp. BvORR071]
MERLRGRRVKGLCLVLLVILTGAALVSVFGNVWVSGFAQKKIDEALSARGLLLQRTSTSWDLVRGLRMTGVKLGYSGQAPMVEVDAAEVQFSLWARLTGRGEEGNQFKTRHSALVLRDERGEIHLEDVSLEAESHRDRWSFSHVKARHEGLLVEVSGEVLIQPGDGKKTEAPPAPWQWQPNFKAVRGTLAALKMESEGKPFRVAGTFQADTRQREPRWTADLEGASDAVVWHGVPLERASARAKLSQGSSKIAANLVLPRGTADFTVEREGWAAAPFHFSGTLADAPRRSDRFAGNYQPGERQWTIERVEGDADLWALARDIPELAKRMPEEKTLAWETFPKITVREAVWKPEGAWKANSLAFEKGKVRVQTKESGELVVNEVKGQVSSDGKMWRIREASGGLLGGQVLVRGKLQDQRLSEAVVSGDDLKLAEVKEAAGKDSGGSKGVLSFRFNGMLDFAERTARGKGTMRVENAPLFSVPLLDETYQLFLSIIPGVERPRTGKFEAVFVAEPGVVEVPRFEATGGSLNVSAKGKVDLKKERVDGVARGKLTGLPGLVTKPLGRLLEMEVGGPYDDIRVKPLGPAKLVSNTVSGTVGTPVETIEEAGKIAGGVLVEGIKLPFRLFGRKGDSAE